MELSSKMELLFWTPVLYSREGFPRDENGNPFIEGKVIEESITSALIFYHIKKDKPLENQIKKLLMELSPRDVVPTVKELIFEKYNLHSLLTLPDRIPLTGGKIYKTPVDVMNLQTWDEVDSFIGEVFEGIINIPIKSEKLELIRAAGHSYTEALLKMEMELLGDHPLVETFYIPMINEVKKWEIPLRTGWWTVEKFKGNLLFFWRIKEIRERFLREFKLDIRPQKVLFLPREGVTAGWAEIKKEV